MTRMEDVILGRDPNPRLEEQNQMVEGTIKSIDAKGVSFVLKDWDNGKHIFGPAPYTWPRHTTITEPAGTGPHTHVVPLPADGPVAGDRCLVVFVGGGVEDPWVIGWWPA